MNLKQKLLNLTTSNLHQKRSTKNETNPCIEIHLNRNSNKIIAEQNPYGKFIEYWLTSWRPYIALIVLGSLVFGRTIWFSYTYFDDDILILNGYDSIKELSKIINAFQSTYLTLYYRPIVTISLILDSQISGLAPWMYHSSNLIFHLIVSCITFAVLLKLHFSRITALFSSALFTVLPITTQTVAWIPGRNDSLVALFILLSFYALLRYQSENRKFFFIFHLVFFFLALLSKETALVFPILCLLFLYGHFHHPLFSKQSIIYFAGWLCVIFLWYVLRQPVVGNIDPAYSVLNMVSNLRVILELFGKMVVPINLSAYPTFSSISLIVGITAVVAFSFLFATNKNMRSFTTVFGLLWIIVMILPSLGVHLADASDRHEYLECRAYSPLFGLSLVIAGIIQPLSSKKSIGTVALFFCAIPFYALITLMYSSKYQDGITHWTHVTTMSPASADGFFNLGIVSMNNENNPQLAIESYQKAIALNPNNYKYYDNLGIAFGQVGSLDKAELQFNKAIALNPPDPIPYSNIGYLYFLKKNFRLAETNLKQAYAIDSNFTKVQILLVNLYYQEKNYDQVRFYADKLQKAGIVLDPQLKQLLDSVKISH